MVNTNINKANNHLSPQPSNTKKNITHGIGNPGPGLGHAQKCDRVKLGNGLSMLPFWLLDLQQKYRYIQMIKKNLHRLSYLFTPWVWCGERNSNMPQDMLHEMDGKSRNTYFLDTPSGSCLFLDLSFISTYLYHWYWIVMIH